MPIYAQLLMAPFSDPSGVSQSYRGHLPTLSTSIDPTRLGQADVIDAGQLEQRLLPQLLVGG